MGTVRQFAVLMFSSTKAPYGLKNKLAEIDQCMLNIKPPSTVHRLPQKASDFKDYKAYEWLCFLFYYSVPILIKFLPEEYFQHWILLVLGAFLLNKEQITSDNLKLAQVCLNEFHNKVGSLYGLRQYTYNVHQLPHLPLFVKRYGPLWATSAFIFENKSGLLGNSVTGNSHLGVEIANKIKRQIWYDHLKYKTSANDDKGLEAKRQNNIQPLRKQDVEKYLRPLEIKKMNEFCNKNPFLVFDRLKINQKLFTSKVYIECRTNNYITQITTNNNLGYSFISITCYFSYQGVMFIMANPLAIVEHKRIVLSDLNTLLSNVLPVQQLNEIIFLKIDDIVGIVKSLLK